MNSLNTDAVLSPQARTRLGEALKALLARRLTPLLSGLFDSLDDCLFELAEHAREPNRQRDLFDGMRECRLRRKQVEESTVTAIKRGLDLAFRDDLRTIGLEPAEARADEALGLVEHEDLEEDLALQAMVAKCESHLAQTLYALNQRIGVVLEIPALDDSDNPLGPAALAEAFRTSARRLDIPMHVRLVVFKLFERHVLGVLNPIYKELNGVLIDASILPTLKPQLREVRGSAVTALRPEPPMPRPIPEAAAAASPAGSVGRADDDSAMLARLIETIGSRRAMAALRSAAQDASGSGVDSQIQAFNDRAADALSAMVERIPTATLQEALEQLQHRSSAAPNPGKLKQHLLEQSHRMVGDVNVALRPADENVVDLVGMLFEQLQQDQRLPATLQKLITQLHVPVLRAALLDQNILSNGQHPARRLIEEIGSAAVGWTAEADPGQRLLNRVKETVDWLRHSFDSDISVFDQALRDFRAFSEAQRRRAELAEQRATEAALGRERLLLARRSVAGALDDRLRGRRIARWLGQLLARPWANFLVLVWLRQGPDSAAYGDALRFVEDLSTASELSPGPQAERLRRRLPELEACMRQGLATVAFHESEIEFLAAQLRSYVAACLQEPGEVAIDQERDAVPAFFDVAIDELEDQPSTDEVADVSQTVALLQSEGTGRWFELKQEGGASERAKLAWISPISTRCLLVNRQGMKVAEQRLESLAADLERGVAQMLDGGLMVQRALEGMMEELVEQSASDLRAG